VTVVEFPRADVTGGRPVTIWAVDYTLEDAYRRAHNVGAALGVLDVDS
jgi:hypothetical protein